VLNVGTACASKTKSAMGCPASLACCVMAFLLGKKAAFG